MRTTCGAILVAAFAAGGARAEFAVDRSVMSDAYWGIWNDVEQARIDADIEKNRKADGAFEVDAPDGAAVRVEQLTHAFRFGAHIFNFNQLGKTEYNDAYKASYGAGGLFNQATVSFYWIDHEPTPGAFRFGGDYMDTDRYWNSLSREEAMRERYWRRPAPDQELEGLQREIDAVSVRGGGRIVVPPGCHETKPFILKDNVTLELAEGAVLLASTNISDYTAQEGERCFIYADNATNVAIVGKGTIAGRGWAFKERTGLMGESQPQALPVMMRFSCCRGVRLEDFTYRDCGAWGCHLRNCDGVTMRRVKCFSHVNNTNDGIDVESSNVLIEDCDIDTDDDALVFKTESDKTFPVTNVVVRNCRLASCCNALKFGTGSYCDFRDILVEGCRFERPKGNFRFDWKKTYADRGVKEDLTGLGGVALEVVDGGCMENVTIRNIDLAGYIVPIFVRLARRNEPADARGSYLRNVLIENVKGACATSRNGCSITGLPDLRPSGITLRNVSLTFPGGGTAAERDLGVPEMERAYPEGVMFGRNLPAWAFYLRHADNVTFDNVKFSLEGDDEREMIVKEDCN